MNKILILQHDVPVEECLVIFITDFSLASVLWYGGYILYGD